MLPYTKYGPDPDSDTVEHYMLPDATIPATFSLQYKGPDGYYHPYNFMGRLAQCSGNIGGKYLHCVGEVNGPTIPKDTVVGQSTIAGWGPARPDPRTDRFSESVWWLERFGTTHTMNPGPNSYYTNAQGSGAGGEGDFGLPNSKAFYFIGPYPPPGSGFSPQPIMWSINAT